MSFSPGLNALATAILIICDKGTIQYLNYAAEKLFGLSGRQIQQASIFELIKQIDSQSFAIAKQQQPIVFEEFELKTAKQNILGKTPTPKKPTQIKIYLIFLKQR